MNLVDLQIISAIAATLNQATNGKFSRMTDIETASAEIRQLVAVANQLVDHLQQLYDYAVPLAHGNLNVDHPPKNNLLASSLKELHSRLLHLTWQTTQIASGDYGQRVDFMGEFSEAFNSMVDILAAERRKQEQLQKEFALAGKLQRELLPPEFDGPDITIKTVYEPFRMISGDFFNYVIDRNNRRVRGYVMDVTGHGMGTALQTSALNILFQEVMRRDLSCVDVLTRINAKACDYFSDDLFGAAFYFEFNLAQMTLTYASGGINFYLTSTSQTNGLVTVPGSLLGIDRCSDFNQITIPLCLGDTFYFASDGLFDLLTDSFSPFTLADFDTTVEKIREIATDERRWDDVSALCLKIK
ncbi:MAG: SpoIIE family protein phosphatase [Negativicutes bacterium]|nr:SpoIIE family protein phosphatase [Negativicutes bacterium]MDR3593110.1 SpoIIE family protein phosphatase [Negativicutes bacterium]